MSEVENTEVEEVTEKKTKKVKEPKVKVEKITQNNITRPRDGSLTAKVWEIADTMSNELGAPVKRADVMKAAAEAGINAATVATQYGKWRKFHGIVVEKVAKEEVAEGEAAE